MQKMHNGELLQVLQHELVQKMHKFHRQLQCAKIAHCNCQAFLDSSMSFLTPSPIRVTLSHLLHIRSPLPIFTPHYFQHPNKTYMGLDWRPMGKAKPGYEDRYNEIFSILTGNTKPANRDELREEWFSLQISTYETIKAPRVGRDKEADDWIKEQYEESEKDVSLEEFVEEMKGYYVILLAKELDGVPVYMAMGQDENVFRGKFLDSCKDLIGEELYEEAYITKMADDTLKYGQQLMEVADKLATEHNVTYLKDQRFPPENWDTIEFSIHVIYAAAKWLIFYGKNGHGFEADY